MGFVLLMDYYYLLPVGVSKWNDIGAIKKRQQIKKTTFRDRRSHVSQYCWTLMKKLNGLVLRVLYQSENTVYNTQGE